MLVVELEVALKFWRRVWWCRFH